MADHARLSASAADRWIECPGSAKLSEGLPNPSSVYAEFGTMAHSIATYCLRKGLNADAIIEEYADKLQVYLDFCRSEMKGPLDRVGIEIKLSSALSKLDKDTGGTADFARWRPTDAELLVTDLKFGTGVTVDVKTSKQIRIYAIGAALHFNVMPKRVRLVVCQPRHENPDYHLQTDTCSMVDLLETFRDARLAAVASRLPSPPIVPGPTQCRWCPAAKAKVCKQAVSYRPRQPVGAFAIPGEFQPVNLKG